MFNHDSGLTPLQCLLAEQASGLRAYMGLHHPQLARPHPYRLKVLPILSNGRADEQANFLANLAVALQRQGRKVLILDVAHGQVGAQLGLASGDDLDAWLRGSSSLGQLLRKSQEQVCVLSAASALNPLRSPHSNVSRLGLALLELAHFDLCLALAPWRVLHCLTSLDAQGVWIMSQAHPAALLKTYQSIKSLASHTALKKLSVFYSNLPNQEQGERTHDCLRQTLAQFTNIDLAFAGGSEGDPMMCSAQGLQGSVFSSAPHSTLAQSFTKIAETISWSSLPTILPQQHRASGSQDAFPFAKQTIASAPVSALVARHC